MDENEPDECFESNLKLLTMIQFCSCIIPYVFEDTPLRIRIGGDSDHSMDGPYFALDLTLDQPYYEWMDDNRTPEPIKDKVVSILKEAFEHPIDAVVDLLVDRVTHAPVAQLVRAPCL